jgi:3',5'-cyclic AMP phosphodiesterase CpdA
MAVNLSLMIRVLHFSDVHVDVPLSEMPLRDLLVPKRMLGAANLELRRRRHFREAREKLAELAHFADREGIDLAICTGDYTALGTEPEMIAARAAIDAMTKRPLGFVTVPGNHDIYVDDAAHERFARVFGELLTSDLPEHAVDGPFPLVRFVGEDLAVVAVNSARPNPQLWRSSGRIPDAQLAALGRVLDDTRVSSRFVLLITHYAPRRADGTPDKKLHGLDNADELLALCERVTRGAILHGHIHRRYHVLGPAGQKLFGAGSATQEHREGIWIFELDSDGSTAIPGSWNGTSYVLDRSASVVF